MKSNTEIRDVEYLAKLTDMYDEVCQVSYFQSSTYLLKRLIALLIDKQKVQNNATN